MADWGADTHLGVFSGTASLVSDGFDGSEVGGGDLAMSGTSPLVGAGFDVASAVGSGVFAISGLAALVGAAFDGSAAGALAAGVTGSLVVFGTVAAELDSRASVTPSPSKWCKAGFTDFV